LWLSCPAEALGDARLYLHICILGLVPQLVYNVANGVLRALGNTKTPLYYLAGSAVLNVVLDITLAVGMGFGLEGVAWSTLFSQWALGFAMLWRLTRLDGRFCLSGNTRFLPVKELLSLLRLGVPSGMQAAFMSISSLLIQISIDTFGPAAMAGMVVYAKIEGFLYYPAFAYGMALTGFIGQNLGSGRLDRVEEAMRISRRTAIYGTMAVCAVLMLLAKPIVAFFTGDPATLSNALAAVYWTFPFYFLYSLNQVYIGGLKGLGETGIPMASALFAYALFRVLWCQALLPYWYDMAVIYNAYNVSFLVSLSILVPAYRRVYQGLGASKGGWIARWRLS
jgi:putative MATE family efflux protein